MLLTIISTVLGIVTSIIPSIIRVWERKQELQYEIELTRLRMEAAAQGLRLTSQIEDIKALVAEGYSVREHDSDLDGGEFINKLRASVRPVLTYAFFGLFVLLKIAVAVAILTQGVTVENIQTVATVILDDTMMGIFGAIIGFWFGSRLVTKMQDFMSNRSLGISVTKTPETKKK